MHSHGLKEPIKANHSSHFNFLFTGWGAHIYDVVMVRLARNLYRCVIEDLAIIGSLEGKVLDAGTGPGTLARDVAQNFPHLQVYGIDLSEEMIQVAREHVTHEWIEERVHFDAGDIAHLPYSDNSFDLIVSTISMHHWYELEQPLRDIYRVLRPGGRLWIYDFRFFNVQMVEKALASTPFAETSLEHTLVRTKGLPFALYRRFALQKNETTPK